MVKSFFFLSFFVDVAIENKDGHFLRDATARDNSCSTYASLIPSGYYFFFLFRIEVKLSNSFFFFSSSPFVNLSELACKTISL